MKKKLVGIVLLGVVILLATISVVLLVQPQAGAPTYKTLLPENKTISQLGGWTRVTPPGQEAAYSFSDTIDTVKITVTQQKLPSSFSSDIAGNIKQVASSYNATTTFEADTTTVYIGTSSKGPQSVIFSRNELLVLIVSEDELPTASWQRYILSLK